jgi:GR25 family glycosyltransferase involved in LPS biosynthesis/tetratricopeptide (TPR) repeat protein
MIVKNEAHLIRDTLEHMSKFFTFATWAISDTGSTDGTQDIIRAFFKERGIDGVLDEVPWQDFAYNRTKAFELAYDRSDYVLVWDADDSIEGNFKLPEKLTGDWYKFTFGDANGSRYSRPQLFNNRKKWKFVGVLHEYAAPVEGQQIGPVTSVLGDYYFISGRRGARSKDPHKYLKDALLLERGLQDEPDNSRYAFYLGNSWMNAPNHEKAAEAYKKTLSMNGWVEEKYMSCNYLWGILTGLGRTEEAIAYQIDAFKYVPDRVECALNLIRHYSGKQNYHVAHAFYTLVQDWYENKFNGGDQSHHLFIDTSAARFHLPYHMIIVAEKLENYTLAARMYEYIFKYNFHAVSDWHIGNLCYNMQFCMEQLPKTQEFLQSALTYKGTRRLKPDQEKAFAKIIKHYRQVLTKSPPYPPLKNKLKPRVFLSITTCKRMDLFTQTMNSIMNTWKDLSKVDYFFCVDDNSSKKDRQTMRRLYPFFEYHLKGPEEKGHRESMNIIWNKLKELQPTYWIHLEDDWLFFHADSYVEKSMNFLDRYRDKKICQVLFNRNYAEESWEWDINGGEALEPGFTVHIKSDTIPGKSSSYWPHYSFRPSMVDVSTILKLGNYDSPNAFFERDYADRWSAEGYRSGFFDNIVCDHIGKLTTDKSGANAYTKNQTSQFGGDTTKAYPHSCYVVNLKRRPDRKVATDDILKQCAIKDYTFFEAVDGKEITPSDQITALFANNDFGSRVGVVGCALSHIALWKQLANDSAHTHYLILEDDIGVNADAGVSLVDGINKVEAFLKKTPTADIVFLGYHVRDNTSRLEKDSKLIHPIQFNKYVGGTYSYIVTKQGAAKILQWINVNGVRHGIDYVLKIIPGLNCYELKPHLVLSDWVQVIESNVDSDIQRDSSSVPMTWKFHKGVDFYGSDIKCIGKKTPKQLLDEAVSLPDCVAVNTLGFMKKCVGDTLKPSQYFGPDDGIWIKTAAPPSEVYINIVGGLCNQIFQIAAAYAHAQKYNKTLKIHHKIGANTPRYWDSVFNAFKECVVNDTPTPALWSEPGFAYSAIPSHAAHITGYFQSVKYFEEIQDKLRTMITLPVVDSVDDTQCVIHVRRGDYLTSPNKHYVCRDQYYTNAVKRMRELVPDVHFTIVTDDIAWARTQQIIPNATVFEDTRDTYALAHIAQHRHIIMSNSSFSWWGVWFGGDHVKTVCVPDTWFGSEGPRDTQDVYMPSWHRVPLYDTTEWVFHPGKDIIGHDIGSIGKRSIVDLINEAEITPNCYAFNTLGFLKSTNIETLELSRYFREGDGIFLRAKNMKNLVRVKLLAHWCDSNQLMESMSRMFRYPTSRLILTDKDDEADYWVIINKPRVSDKYDPARTIVIQMEPRCEQDWQCWGTKTWGEWANPDPNKFLHVWDSSIPAVWELKKPLCDVAAPINTPRLDRVAHIASERYTDPGQKYRIDFVRHLERDANVPVSVYGHENYHGFTSYKGTVLEDNRWNVLTTHKYYFMCENNAEKNYVTEKLWEPILCETLCFYWGAPNIAEIIDPDAYVVLDMEDFDKSYQTVKRAIAEDWWSARLPAIRRAKQQILEWHNIAPALERTLVEKRLMRTRLDKKSVYTKENITGIASLCDWVICRQQCLRLKNTEFPRILFLSGYDGHIGFSYFYYSILPQITSPFTLIIASEDSTFPNDKGEARFSHYSMYKKEIETLLAHPLLIKVFVENLDSVHPKLTAIPLGITTDTLEPSVVRERNGRVLICHRIREDGSTQWDDRKHVKKLGETEWSSFADVFYQLTPTEFKKALETYSFVVCVHGGGYDPSPRAWESLYYGAIPIIAHSPVDEAYQEFPVAWVDTWDKNAITPEKLKEWSATLPPVDQKKLRMNYWWSKIKAAATK